MIEIAIGIIAYNEEKNLPKLLDIIKDLKIKELFLFSDGSTDKTNNIIMNFKGKKTNNVYKIIGKKRRGKYFRINQFIEKTTCDILLLCNGDILPKEGFLKKIIKFMQDKTIAIITTRGVCVNKKDSLLNQAVHVYWELHHEFSLIQPKGTGLLALRKERIKLPKTSVDEIYLISLLEKKGRIKYADNITYYTKSPEKLSEFVKQIRRYHNGHKIVAKKTNFKDITLNYVQSIKIIFNYLTHNTNKILLFFMLLCIEMLGRILANFDYFFKEEQPVWDVAESTKNLKI